MTIRTLSPELAEKARVELNEDPRRIDDDIQHMKDWIAKQPHLQANTDDQFLVAFLRGCKFSLERAKQKIDLYYTLRSTAPDLFRVKYNTPKFMEIFDLGVALLLPNTKSTTSPFVSLFRPGMFDPNKYHIADIMSVCYVVQEIQFYENDALVINGVSAVVDLQGISSGHMLQGTPALLKKLTVMGQDAVPLRLKGTHYLNTPPGMETIFNIMKGFLNEKNKQRVHIHNKNYDEMYKHIPKEVLPTEYGGDGGTIKEIIEYWRNKIQSYSSWIEEGMENSTIESKRPGKPRTAADLFGIEGSFRQLHID